MICTTTKTRMKNVVVVVCAGFTLVRSHANPSLRTPPFPGTDDCIKMYLNGTRSHTTCKHMSHATTAILATGYSYEHCTRGWYIIIWPSLAPRGGISPVSISSILLAEWRRGGTDLAHSLELWGVSAKSGGVQFAAGLSVGLQNIPRCAAQEKAD